MDIAYLQMSINGPDTEQLFLDFVYSMADRRHLQ